MTEEQIYVRDSRNGRIRHVGVSYLTILKTEHPGWEQISAEDALADTHYVRNAGGAVHSIPSVDLAEALAVEGTEEISEDEARKAFPALFGMS